MQTILVPSIPPASPYEAYLLLLVIPFFFRFFMILPPLFEIIAKFGGDAKWFLARVRQIRIKGLYLLIINEILALSLPFALALYARASFDPLGWKDWEHTPDLGFWLLIGVAIFWLYLDLLRVARTRRLLRAVSDQNRFIAKAAVEAAAGARGILDYLRMLSPLDMHSDIQAADDIMEGRVDPNEEQEEETSIARLGRLVKDRAVLAAETVSEVIRGKAEEASEILDEKIEQGVHTLAGTSVFLLMRDILMSLAPVAILILLQQHW